MVLSYFELPEDEIPSDRIWHHPTRLEEWFAAIKQRRDSGMQPVDAGEDTEMTSNAYLDELKGADNAG